MKSNRKTSLKRDPLLAHETPLSFDNISENETLKLSEEQAKDAFLSKWMDVVDPFIEYPKIFKNDAAESRKLLREIKNFYKRYVIDAAWSEKKYVFVINSIFETRSVFGPYSIERFGKLYDTEALPSQRRLKRLGARR
jgi:hypothetical protein